MYGVSIGHWTILLFHWWVIPPDRKLPLISSSKEDCFHPWLCLLFRSKSKLKKLIIWVQISGVAVGKVFTEVRQPQSSDKTRSSKRMFPNVFKYLKLGATLPVTESSAECSFLSLKRLKTYLRNSTSQNRLNGLALLAIHRNIHVDIDAVLDIFAWKK